MKNRISSEYAPRMKVLIFANLMYYRIVIVENTQAQCFDNLISNCARVFSTMTCDYASTLSNINAFFLAPFTEPILVFAEQRNGKRQQLTDAKGCFSP